MFSLVRQAYTVSTDEDLYGLFIIRLVGYMTANRKVPIVKMCEDILKILCKTHMRDTPRGGLLIIVQDKTHAYKVLGIR